MSRIHWTPAILALGLVVLPQLAHGQQPAGMASLGGSVGVPFFLADEDLSKGQAPRAIGKAHFQYLISPTWRLSLRGGYGWVGYSREEPAPFPLQGCCGTTDETKIDQITVVNPFTAALQYTRPLNQAWLLYGGGGLGLYRINVLNDRKTVHDPVTRERILDWSPGLTGEGGVEHFLAANRNVSFELGGTIHVLFGDEKDKYPSGYSGPHSFFDIDFGVNVYFRPPGTPATVKPVLPSAEASDDTSAPDAAAEGEAETPAEPPPAPDSP